MCIKRLGSATVSLSSPPVITAAAAIGGKKEGQGPLRDCFDRIIDDAYCGCQTWEQAESALLRQAFDLCCGKAQLSAAALDYLFAGDLLAQCVSSSFALRDVPAPCFGLYGACSTIIEGLSLAAMAIDGGYADHCAAMTSSHFCSAERQFRLPLEYGGQRSPVTQWTVTGAAALILSAQGTGPAVTYITTGRIVDAGIKDAGNMGAAMAPAACETLTAHFHDTGRRPADYDAIITGDLGRVGHGILMDLCKREGLDLGKNCTDCGILIFDPREQDVHAGGSGCGCCASVLAGYIVPNIISGKWKRVLVAATGALLSPTTALQGESIPGICHAVALEGR